MRRRTGREEKPDGLLFVDSGAWIALVHRGDQYHATADRMFRQAADEEIPLLTTNLVVAEVQRLLLFRAGIQAAATFLDRVDASRLVKIEFANEIHHRSARDWLDRLHDQKITYTDAVSFAVMKAKGCSKAISFDSDFVIAGFQPWHLSR